MENRDNNINNSAKKETAIALLSSTAAILITIFAMIYSPEGLLISVLYALFGCLLPIALGIIAFSFVVLSAKKSGKNPNAGGLLFTRISALAAVAFSLARLVSVAASVVFMLIGK